MRPIPDHAIVSGISQLDLGSNHITSAAAGNYHNHALHTEEFARCYILHLNYA